MKTSAIRDRLYDYIRVADDEKIKAMYVMLKNEINEDLKWWEDNEFIKELDAGYSEWKNGKAKGYTIEEVNASIDELRIKRNHR